MAGEQDKQGEQGSTVSRVEFPVTPRQRALYATLCEIGRRDGPEVLLRELTRLPDWWTLTSLLHAIREGQL